MAIPVAIWSVYAGWYALRVAAAKKSRALRGLVLQASPNNNSQDIRVGYTASRRVGNAVRRNHARRRLRAAVREVMPFHAARGYDYVVIARAATVARPFSALRSSNSGRTGVGGRGAAFRYL